MQHAAAGLYLIIIRTIYIVDDDDDDVCVLGTILDFTLTNDYRESRLYIVTVSAVGKVFLERQ